MYMKRVIFLLPFILSFILIMVSSVQPIDLVFSSHDAEESVIFEFGEDFVSEESVYNSWFFIKGSASKKDYAIRISGKVKLQFKDVETPPPESKVA